MAKADEYVKVFKAFSDYNRVRVLELLQEGEKCACTLLADLNISQSTLSHHMKILCNSGIVKSRPVGKWSYYAINDSGCAYAQMLIDKLITSNNNSAKLFSHNWHYLLLAFKGVIATYYFNRHQSELATNI